ncbi:CPBP family intramembrane glutamic endopeptidase [Streptococcus australis]|uniref:CAAX amino protease family protein n=1 Tax=Streptococcus australis TaxID=113107 RepID=A0A4V0BX32_9STRE|nr:CPBP family intramembrane glutamic endopeptidase [Streptococcus australis]VTS71804.1 CAAX amino protease family protein [Streptococcus australis]
MKILQIIHPSQPLRYLRWFDILIITVLMFGQFIIRSTKLFLASMFPTGLSTTMDTASNTVSEGVGYLSNFTLQVILLILTFLYLLIRNYDFKQLPIRWTWSLLFWVPFIFAIVGLFGDLVTTLTGEYNYLNPALFAHIDLMEIIRKFLALSPMTIAYALLNGFYEEFFFLGLLTSVREKHKWRFLLYSTIIRISFHTYQGVVWALVIGVVYGLFYYFLYKYKLKNLLPFFLMHALADMFGSSLMYLLIAWGA